ncbi:anhydro-N-acetylmuramic acid kinase [Zavarzinia aquatilis]|uniref:Anhydro-N-acetylmuramic acid kinase n=1 Tax=Zavarzinia aquatilis TaxID=2211142 RepID=A0A317EGB2_9PROT|nr:anhydro-N-acetylmuramic acid kinase [Zavarzinia aquatilis]PWR26047.1 anhydro-N-acetylmuramic acid kinase [Zavarzinia aquatilis]
MKALGLMSGTSLDGIDLAVIESDGLRVTAFGPALTVPHLPATRAACREASRQAAGWRRGDPVPAAVEDAAARITEAHRLAIHHFLATSGETGIELIGFHGQTVLHRPAERLTWQIGDAQALADAFAIPVIGQMRLADVEAGGQGAPLVPLYHRALLLSSAAQGQPVAVLNLGGVGNVTWLDGEAEPVAFDTGPGNALIDDWALQHTGVPIDRDGALAAAGRVHGDVLAALMDHPYFDLPAPKSLDRDDFTLSAVRGLSTADGAATLTAFTAETVAAAFAQFPAPVSRVLVTGGGRLNPTLMAMLKRRLGLPVLPVEAMGWRGDSLEAEAFAFLALRSLKGLPLSVPGTTGVPRPLTGGQLFRPSRMSR